MTTGPHGLNVGTGATGAAGLTTGAGFAGVAAGFAGATVVFFGAAGATGLAGCLISTFPGAAGAGVGFAGAGAGFAAGAAVLLTGAGTVRRKWSRVEFYICINLR